MNKGRCTQNAYTKTLCALQITIPAINPTFLNTSLIDSRVDSIN